MKRYLAIVAAVLLLLASAPMVVAESGAPAPAESPCFVVQQTEGKVGGTVDVTISAVNNPGIVSTRMMVHYDDSVLKLLAVTDGDFSANGYSYSSNLNQNPFVVNWCDAIHADNTAELLATLTFEVLGDAAYGPSAITLAFSCEDDVYNYDWETVEFTAVDGGVYVLYPVTGVELDQSVLNVYNGDSAVLTATVQAAGQTDEAVIWTTDNDSVVVVDRQGMVTAMGLGTAVVTVTTAEGGFVASCDVVVTCAHRRTTAVDAVASTCVTPGHVAYVRCNDCGEVIDGTDADLPLDVHHYESAVTVQESCGTDGVLTYTCAVCGDLYTEVIPATGAHTFDHACDTYCNGCDLVREVAPHPYQAVITAPTCGAEGYTTRTCEQCGDSYTDTPVPATGEHTYDNRDDIECNGCAHVRNYPGDVNGDGKVNNRDLGMLQKHLNDLDSQIDEVAADLNSDGKINNRDLGIFQRYLNGWDVDIK